MKKNASKIIQGMLQSCSDIEQHNSEIEFVNPKNSPVQQEKTTNIQAHRKKRERKIVYAKCLQVYKQKWVNWTRQREISKKNKVAFAEEK